MATHHDHAGHVNTEVPIPRVEVECRDIAQRASHTNYPYDNKLASNSEVNFRMSVLPIFTRM